MRIHNYKNVPFIQNFPFLTFFLFLLLIPNLISQKCSTDELRLDQIKNNPFIIDEEWKNEEKLQNWINENTDDKHHSKIITLPVVVHVIWKQNEQNISDDQIYSQMEALNRDFRLANVNYTDTPEEFRNFAIDTEIEFCLASMDPSGRSTKGITRTETYVDKIGDTKQYYNSAQGGRSPWDNTRYINIWVCDIGRTGVIGFATAPGIANPRESDGLVINWKNFGTTGTAEGAAPNHLGRTTTHEMGHYFNLNHLWGRDKGGCEEDDFVNDTPFQNSFTKGCPNFPFYDVCTAQGDGIMYNNYMDYTDDACMTMFTIGQKQRMLAAINNLRTSLLFSNVCQLTTATNDLEISNRIIQIHPNPAQSFIRIIASSSDIRYPLDIEIINIDGKLHQTMTLHKNQEIDISQYPSGTYLLKINELNVRVFKFQVIR